MLVSFPITLNDFARMTTDGALVEELNTHCTGSRTISRMQTDQALRQDRKLLMTRIQSNKLLMYDTKIRHL